MNKIRTILSGIGKGWKKMPIGKKIYALLWSITGTLLITLIVMFVALNSTYKDSVPPKDGWAIKTQEVLVGETKPDITTYEVQEVTKTRDQYELMSTAKKDADFKLKFNENAFLVNGESLGTKISGKTGQDAYLNDYTPIQNASPSWTSKVEYISPNNKRGWFTATTTSGVVTHKFDTRVPIYVVKSWNTTPTSKAKSATTATATIAFIWAITFAGSIFLTVVVSKKAKGGN